MSYRNLKAPSEYLTITQRDLIGEASDPNAKPLLRVSIKGGVLEDNRPLYGMEAGKEKDLTSTQRDEIRRLHFTEGMDAKAIAERLGLDPGNVGKAIGGMKRWGNPASHVLDAEAISPKSNQPARVPEPEKVFMNLDPAATLKVDDPYAGATISNPVPEPPVSLKIEGTIIRPGEAEQFAAKLMETIKSSERTPAPATIDEIESLWQERQKADGAKAAMTGSVCDLLREIRRFFRDPEVASDVARKAVKPIEERYRRMGA